MAVVAAVVQWFVHMKLTAMARQMVTARWDALIPRRAKAVEIVGKHVRYLHPTKGWKRVGVKRLVLA